MARIICIVHMAEDGPCLINSWAEARGISIETVAIYDGEPLLEPDPGDMIVIMGGSMGAYEEERYPWLAAEKSYLSRHIMRRIRCFGICLGAQILAECLGGTVVQNSLEEIGYFPVNLSPLALETGLFSGLDSPIVPLHWHRDTFSIPQNTQHLAFSQACRNQGFWCPERKVLGLQFHIEADQDLGVTWALEAPEEIASAGQLPQGRFVQAVDQIRTLAQEHSAANRRFLFQLLDRLWAM